LSEDITQRKHAEAQIAYMSRHDALTRLPNRVAFSAHLASTLSRAAASGENFAVVCVDLDRFKEVNDIFGHPVGDGLLQAVSTRLQAAAEGAILTRIGGDEFTLISTGQPQAAIAEAHRPEHRTCDLSGGWDRRGDADRQRRRGALSSQSRRSGQDKVLRPRDGYAAARKTRAAT
jgi:GGDEF domain-containing protein